MIVLFVVPLPLIQALALGLPSIYASDALAIQWGSIAYVWFLVAIYLSTRPKWLDRLIGLPSVYFIHGVLSLLAIGLAFLHKEGTHSFGLIRQTGDWAFDLFLGLMVYSLVFMAGWLTSRFGVLRWIKRQLERLFHHEFIRVAPPTEPRGGCTGLHSRSTHQLYDGGSQLYLAIQRLYGGGSGVLCLSEDSVNLGGATRTVGRETPAGTEFLRIHFSITAGPAISHSSGGLCLSSLSKYTGIA
ncbi:hypothetical protein [Levilactobacillus sp. N40-8-2]|uniref:hypothetical protein n=1 Tax=Levilactobacillus muriae TaxID=3238987 RepID=UPI0038B39CE6